MKIAEILDNLIWGFFYFFALAIVVKMLYTGSGSLIISSLFIVVIIIIAVLAFIYTNKGRKKSGKVLFDLSIRKKYKAYKADMLPL